MDFLSDILINWPAGLIEGGAFIWLFRAWVERRKAQVEAKIKEVRKR